MAEYNHEKETVVKKNEPVIFQNNTDSSFDVAVGVIFRKSGLYRVVIDDNNKITITTEPERKTGEWNYTTHYRERYRVCPFCGCEKKDDRATGWNFCQYCGADMRGESE